MGSKTKLKRIPAAPVVGPTPERLAKGDVVAMIEPPESEGRANRNAVTKITRFVPAPDRLDALYKLSAIDFWQWWAGSSYRDWMQDGWPERSIVADYGDRTSSGIDMNPLPVSLSPKAEAARMRLKKVQRLISIPHRHAIEEAITGTMQDKRGRARMVQLDFLRSSLTSLYNAIGAM